MMMMKQWILRYADLYAYTYALFSDKSVVVLSLSDDWRERSRANAIHKKMRIFHVGHVCFCKCLHI